MVRTGPHDPLALFAFALRERDWVLADLIVATRWREAPARDEFERALREAGGDAGPATLERLHRWAELLRFLERVGGR
jgi:hypothetical protein